METWWRREHTFSRKVRTSGLGVQGGRSRRSRGLQTREAFLCRALAPSGPQPLLKPCERNTSCPHSCDLRSSGKINHCGAVVLEVSVPGRFGKSFLRPVFGINRTPRETGKPEGLHKNLLSAPFPDSVLALTCTCTPPRPCACLRMPIVMREQKAS